MKGNDSTDQGETKRTKKYTDKSCNLKSEQILLTVPIEEITRWQYETFMIIFALNLQSITIALDVVKWRGEGVRMSEPKTLLLPPSPRNLTNTAVVITYTTKHQ